MLTHVLRERLVVFPEGPRPNFPNDVTVNVRLAPKVPFGGHAGLSRSVVAGMEYKARANMSTGNLVFEIPHQLFPPLDASVTVDRVTFQINGDIASTRLQGASFDDFMGLLHILSHSFPVFLNVVIPESPSVLYAWGDVGGVKFHSQFEPTEIQGAVTVTSKEGQEEQVLQSWRRAQLLSRHRRLMNGLHYLHVATRLLGVGHNRFEFMSEALLNLAKSLQSVFGESRDSVRAELVKLGVDRDTVERKYIPYLVLRNEFDVGHVSLAQLTRDQCRTLHQYTDRAEVAFRELYKRLLEKLDSGEYVLLADTPEALSRDRVAVLERLAANLNTPA
jgi:hypothetical protein